MNRIPRQTIERVIAAVRRAFEHVPPVAETMLCSVQDLPELSLIRASLRAQPWQEVGEKDLLEVRDSIPFLSPEAFHAYVPAFVILCLTMPRPQLDVLWDNLISNLTPRNSAVWHRKAAFFSVAQIQAIEQFLEVASAQEHAEWPSMPADADRAGLALARWRQMRGSE